MQPWGAADIAAPVSHLSAVQRKDESAAAPAWRSSRRSPRRPAGPRARPALSAPR